MDRVLAMILAGGRVGELSVLTHGRAKAAVPFGGAYRIIDFPLSNLMHSGIGRVGILSQYRPGSLIDHVGVGQPWDLAGRNRGVRILPPFKGMDETDWYKGTADALFQNIDFIESRAPEVLLILSGDHIYQMDYRPIIKAHLDSGAGMTICLKKVPLDEASRFGVASMDGSGVVTEYREKPVNPQSDLASLTIYVADRKLLVEELRYNARIGKTYQIYDEIIPRLVERRLVRGHVFDGYWAYARTIADYYRANMDLLGDKPVVDLNSWKIRTNMDQDAPTLCGVGEGTDSDYFPCQGDQPPAVVNGGPVQDSMLAEGTRIDGQVERSIVSPGVYVAPGAVVRDSILMHRVRVEAGAVVDHAIVDKDVIIGRGARVGEGDMPGRPNLREERLLNNGLVLVGKGATIPGEVAIGRNVIVYPGTEERHYASSMVESGSTIIGV